MKIISKYKEYYDGVVNSLGIDDTIIYLREKLNDEFLNLQKFPLYYTYNTTSHYLAILGFAGELYPILYRVTSDGVKCEYDESKIRDYFKYEVNKYYNHFNYDSFKQLLNNQTILNYFFEYKCGSFLLRIKDKKTYWDPYDKLILSIEPDLKKYNFHTQVDSYTAFIKMQNFISEQLNTEIDSYEVSDKTKILTKGFDYKKSFRKQKK